MLRLAKNDEEQQSSGVQLLRGREREDMNSRAAIRALGLLLAAACLLFTPLARAQEGVEEESKGLDSGNYNTQQTLEVGYRSTWIDGNQGNYGTFVNLNSGPRLLYYTLSMRSLDHHGALLDGLHFSNFGYGGDPNNVSRLRIDKNKWYDFQAMFRQDQNSWNYNLFLNPFNPTVMPPTNPATNPTFAVNSATHQLKRLKRLQDYNLTLLWNHACDSGWVIRTTWTSGRRSAPSMARRPGICSTKTTE